MMVDFGYSALEARLVMTARVNFGLARPVERRVIGRGRRDGPIQLMGRGVWWRMDLAVEPSLLRQISARKHLPKLKCKPKGAVVGREEICVVLCFEVTALRLTSPRPIA